LENSQEKDFEKTVNWQKSVSLRNQQKKRDPSRAGDLIADVLKNLEPKSKRHSSLMEIWQQILPEGFQDSCQAIGMDGSVLKIKVVSPAWMYQLSLHSEEFVAKLNETRAGAKVRKIKFEL
jgi:hypothetical protein